MEKDKVPSSLPITLTQILFIFEGLFILEKKRAHMSLGGGGAEGERESQANSLLSTEPDAGLGTEITLELEPRVPHSTD